MIIYLAAHHAQTYELAKFFPNQVGQCIQPKHWGKFKNKIPYFLDNNGYSDYIQGKPFNDRAFLALLEKCQKYSIESNHWPDFVVCPDKLFDAKKTAKNWKLWQPIIKDMGFKVAFVCQPGFTEIPKNTDVIFTGGDKPFKFEIITKLKKDKPIHIPIHIGGISATMLEWCKNHGASSGDSSGFFRGDKIQYRRLINFLKK